MNEILTQLIKLNLEIEGALRVLQVRDNDDVRNLLNEKVKSFSDLYSSLFNVMTDDEMPFPEVEIPESFVDEISDADLTLNLEPDIDDSLVNESNNLPEPEIDDISESEMFSKSPTELEPESEPELVSEPEPDFVLESEPELQPDFEAENNIIDEIDDEKDIQIIEEEPVEKIVEAPQQYTLPTSASETEPEHTLSDMLTTTETRLENVLAMKETKTLASAFTLNDKFRFIRGIFCDDNQDFDYTVDRLSQCESLAEVYDYLLNEQGWDVDNDEVKDFITIVANYFNAV